MWNQIGEKEILTEKKVKANFYSMDLSKIIR